MAGRALHQWLTLGCSLILLTLSGCNEVAESAGSDNGGETDPETFVTVKTSGLDDDETVTLSTTDDTSSFSLAKNQQSKLDNLSYDQFKAKYVLNEPANKSCEIKSDGQFVAIIECVEAYRINVVAENITSSKGEVVVSLYTDDSASDNYLLTSVSLTQGTNSDKFPQKLPPKTYYAKTTKSPEGQVCAITNTDSTGIKAFTVNSALSLSVDCKAETEETELSANAGGNLSVIGKSEVTLDGSASTGAVSFLWSQSGTTTDIELKDADKAKATFTAPDVENKTNFVFKLVVTNTAGDTDEQSVTITVSPFVPDNIPPVADAGGDEDGKLMAVATKPVTLSGVSSKDDDGEIVKYLWTETSSAKVALKDADTSLASFVAPDYSSNTTLTFKLTVTDNLGASSTDEVKVIVQPATVIPKPPVVTMPKDVSKNEDDTVYLTATASDPNGDAMTFLWQQTDGASPKKLEGATTTNLIITPPEVTKDTILTFSFIATDKTGLQSEAGTVKVTIKPVNTAPTAVITLSQSEMDEKTTQSLSAASSSDSDGTIASYEWTVSGHDEASINYNANSSTATLNAPDVTEDTTLTITLKVIDNEGTPSASATKQVKVKYINNAPKVKAKNDFTVNVTRISDNNSGKGGGIEYAELTADASDDDNDKLTYYWEQVDTNGYTVQLNADDKATVGFSVDGDMAHVETHEPDGYEINETKYLTFQVTVSDGKLEATDKVTVTLQANNTAPTAEAGDAQTKGSLESVSLNGSDSYDTYTSTLSYKWEQTSGDYVALSSDSIANPTFTAPQTDSQQTLTFRLTVTDKSGKTGTDTVNITVEPLGSLVKISADGAYLPASATDWSCVADTANGLMWEKKTTSGLHNADNKYSYKSSPTVASFMSSVNSTGLCGAKNWRVPTLDELKSIIDSSRSMPAINTTYFPHTKYDKYASYAGYWSSTTTDSSGTSYYYVNYGLGVTNKTFITTNYSVRLVRNK